MQIKSILSARRVVACVFCTLTVAVAVADQQRTEPSGHTITGRVVDPHGLKPEGAVLMIGRDDHAGSFGLVPIVVREDGSFVTSQLSPARYILQIVRTPHSSTKPAVVVGFRIVDVVAADVTGVTVAVRPDTAITGQFRMESDTPNPVWPPVLVVNAFMALEGSPLFNGVVADGAPGGKFVLRNAFGPRVVRCGYTQPSGDRWSFSRVTLDGVDITNVPTDFSEHPDAQLEVVFTQRPARIAGTVTDTQGKPIRAPWILVSAADRTLWQPWATTSDVAQGDTLGRFSLAVRPGRYLVRGLPQAAFSSSNAARGRILELTPGGITVEVGDREISSVRLTVQP
jgi:hypothetical protein